MLIKNLIKNLLGQIATNNFTWRIVKVFAKAGSFLTFKRKKLERLKYDATLKEVSHLFTNKEVLNGPFKGLKYSSFESAGSTLYPKLIGSYERELNEIIELICSKKYSQILDIGCAEGYYAIGLSIRIPEAKIYACDIDKRARKLCKDMAELNGVEHRVIISNTCTPEELETFSFIKRALIICDCEGYELNLFNKRNLANLSNCDLLIETHDFLNINITDYLKKLFSESHEIISVKSIDDIEKAKTYEYNETKNMSLETKKILFSESRPAIMEWLFCKSKI